MSKINKIRLSGTTYDIEDSGATKTVEVTQAEYDALVSGGTVDPNTFYVITDATAADLSQYWTSAQTQSAITNAVSGKQDTLISGTNIKTINNESILGEGNITIQGGGGGIDSGTVQTMIDESISGKVDTSAVTSSVTSASTNSEIPTAKAVNDKLGGTSIVRLTQAQYDALTTKDPNTVYYITDATPINMSDYQPLLSAGTNITITDNVISAQLEGGGVSRADVEDMISAATSGYVESSAITEEITAAVSGKQDTLISGTNIKTINNESILGSGNITIEGGGGTTYSAGTNIDITNDTISCTIPLVYKSSNDSLKLHSGNTITEDAYQGYGNYIFGNNSTIDGFRYNTGSRNVLVGFLNRLHSPNYNGIFGYNNNIGVAGNERTEYCYVIGTNNQMTPGVGSTKKTDYSHIFGYNNKIVEKTNNFIIGTNNTVSGGGSCFIFGRYNSPKNAGETLLGVYCNSLSDGTTSGNTLFSIGNGTADNARHNAFEIRQNGDIYITSGSSDIKLQDHLGGGGGGSITIDPSLDSGSTNAVANSAITSALTIDKTYLEVSDTSTIPTIAKTDKITKIYINYSNYTTDWGVYATAGNNNTYTSQNYYPSQETENDFVKSYILTNQGYLATQVLEAKEGYWIWNVTASHPYINVKTFRSTEGGLVNAVVPNMIQTLDEMEVSLDNKINTVSSAIPTVTNQITSGSTDVITSGAVYDAIGDIESLLSNI